MLLHAQYCAVAWQQFPQKLRNTDLQRAQKWAAGIPMLIIQLVTETNPAAASQDQLAKTVAEIL